MRSLLRLFHMISSMHKKIYHVWGQYDLGRIAEIKKLLGGLINETYYVINDGQSEYIVQRLQGIFSKCLMNDIEAIAEHLVNQGWRCPMLVHSKNGDNHILIQSEIWRVYKYIDAKDFSLDLLSDDSYFEIGNLLGSLHKSLSTMKYFPLHKIKGFHDKNFYINKALVKQGSYSESLRGILEKVLNNLEKYSKNLENFKQLIHGDPRIENILFSSKNKPCTFIDYDTFMFSSIYIDIGDCLRSLMSLDDRLSFSNRIKQFIDGYQKGNHEVGLSYNEAVSALKYVTLELTLRFLIDSVEQKYFIWDPEHYESSAEHNEVRARQSWDLFNKIDQEL